MKKEANQRGKGSTCAELHSASPLSDISSDRAAQRTRLLKPHKTNQLKGASRRRALTGTNDFTVSVNSAEDTFDLQAVIAPATGFPYSLRDVEEGGSPQAAAAKKSRKLAGIMHQQHHALWRDNWLRKV